MNLKYHKEASRWILVLIQGGIFLTLFLPIFMHSQFFFPFIVPKNILFRISVEILLILYVLLAYLDPAYRPRINSKILWALIGFGLVATITTFTGIGVYRSFWGNYERMSGLFHLLHLLAYFFVLFNVIKRDKQWYGFASFSIFVSLLMCLVGFSQWIGADFLLQSSGGARITGTIGNAAFVAAYLLFSVAFLVYFLIKQEKFDFKVFGISSLGISLFLIMAALLSKISPEADWGMVGFLKTPLLLEATTIADYNWKTTLVYWFYIPLMIIGPLVWWLKVKGLAFLHLLPSITPARIFLAIVLALHLFILWHTQTRGALIALYLSMIAGLALIVWRQHHQIYRLMAMVVLAILLIAPVAVVLAKDSPLVVKNHTLRRLATISFDDTTTESRLVAWQSSLKGWVTNPRIFFLGTGLENYYYIFDKNFPIEIYKKAGSQIWFDRAHNIILDIGVTTGIVGLIVYLFILLLAGYQAVKNALSDEDNQSLGWILALLLGAYFIQNFFVFDTLNTEIPFYFVLALIVFMSFKSADDGQDNKSTDWFFGNIIYPTIAILFLAVVILGVNIKTIQANHAIYKAFKAPIGQNSPFSQEKFNYFKQAIESANTGRFEARDQLANYIFEASQYPDYVNQLFIQAMDFTVDELIKSVEEEPLNVRYRLSLANMFNAFSYYKPGLLDQGIRILEDGIWLSENRPQIYFELAKAYALKGEIAKGTELFRYGVDLSPNIIDSRWNMMIFYISTGQFDQAEQEQAAMEELGWRPTENDYLKIINTYARVKNYPKIVEIYQYLLSVRDSAEYYAQLAMVYARMGQNDLARQTVEKVVERSPGFRQDAQIFLEKLEQGELRDDDFDPNKI